LTPSKYKSSFCVATKGAPASVVCVIRRLLKINDQQQRLRWQGMKQRVLWCFGCSRAMGQRLRLMQGPLQVRQACLAIDGAQCQATWHVV
jgi:hypothetical protein